MSNDRKFDKESQDARRHDQQHATHPGDKLDKKSKTNTQLKNTKKK